MIVDFGALTTTVSIDFVGTHRAIGLQMTSIPRVGDFVNGDKVTRVDWFINEDRYSDDPQPTYSVVVSVEEV